MKLTLSILLITLALLPAAAGIKCYSLQQTERGGQWVSDISTTFEKKECGPGITRCFDTMPRRTPTHGRVQLFGCGTAKYCSKSGFSRVKINGESIVVFCSEGDLSNKKPHIPRH